MTSESLQTKKPHKLFGMIFSRRRTYEIINISDIIICILFLFILNFVEYKPYLVLFLLVAIVFLLISSATFFTYFYYRSFGTKMHYAYFLGAVIFDFVSIAMTVVTALQYFQNEAKDLKDAKDRSGFLLSFLVFMSLYQSYLIFVLVKIFFLK